MLFRIAWLLVVSPSSSCLLIPSYYPCEELLLPLMSVVQDISDTSSSFVGLCWFILMDTSLVLSVLISLCFVPVPFLVLVILVTLNLSCLSWPPELAQGLNVELPTSGHSIGSLPGDKYISSILVGCFIV